MQVTLGAALHLRITSCFIQVFIHTGTCTLIPKHLNLIEIPYTDPF